MSPPVGSARSGVIGARAVDVIPDSAIVQFDAQSAFDSGDDGTTISTWPDKLGNSDATGGSPTVRENGINGFRSVEFDGVDDILDSTFTSSLSQPNTVLIVFEANFDITTQSRQQIFSSPVGGERHVLSTESSSWTIFAGGNFLSGSSDSSIQLITGVYDGGGSLLRETGAQTASGIDVGGENMGGIRLGASPESSEFWDGNIGEVVVCDARLSSAEIDNQEQRLANKWGITI